MDLTSIASSSQIPASKASKAYFKWQEADDAALLAWFTYIDSSGVFTNAREFTLRARARAAQRALREIPLFSSRPSLTADKIKTKLASMIATYKKARDKFNKTGEGISELDQRYVMGRLLCSHLEQGVLTTIR